MEQMLLLMQVKDNADESSAAGETSAEESQEAQTEAPESAGESSDAAVAIQ